MRLYGYPKRKSSIPLSPDPGSLTEKIKRIHL